MTEPQTYTPAAYWHRLDDEILEPRQTVTVEPKAQKPQNRNAYMRAYYHRKRAERAVNLDWRGVPFPQEAR